jgi:hypothetical protein
MPGTNVLATDNGKVFSINLDPGHSSAYAINAASNHQKLFEAQRLNVVSALPPTPFDGHWPNTLVPAQYRALHAGYDAFTLTLT